MDGYFSSVDYTDVANRTDRYGSTRELDALRRDSILGAFYFDGNVPLVPFHFTTGERLTVLGTNSYVQQVNAHDWTKAGPRQIVIQIIGDESGSQDRNLKVLNEAVTAAIEGIKSDPRFRLVEDTWILLSGFDADQYRRLVNGIRLPNVKVVPALEARFETPSASGMMLACGDLVNFATALYARSRKTLAAVQLFLFDGAELNSSDYAPPFGAADVKAFLDEHLSIVVNARGDRLFHRVYSTVLLTGANIPAPKEYTDPAQIPAVVRQSMEYAATAGLAHEHFALTRENLVQRLVDLLITKSAAPDEEDGLEAGDRVYE